MHGNQSTYGLMGLWNFECFVIRILGVAQCTIIMNTDLFLIFNICITFNDRLFGILAQPSRYNIFDFFFCGICKIQ